MAVALFPLSLEDKKTAHMRYKKAEDEVATEANLGEIVFYSKREICHGNTYRNITFIYHDFKKDRIKKVYFILFPEGWKTVGNKAVLASEDFIYFRLQNLVISILFPHLP